MPILQELTLITSLVSKLKACPEMLPLFAHQARPGDVSHASSRRSSNASSLMDLSSEQEECPNFTRIIYISSYFFAELEEQLELQGSKKMLEDYESR